LSEADLEAAAATHAAAARAKNRVMLAWILAACVVLATLGFLFALWLRGRPAGH